MQVAPPTHDVPLAYTCSQFVVVDFSLHERPQNVLCSASPVPRFISVRFAVQLYTSKFDLFSEL